MSKKLTKFVKENRKTVAIAAVAIVAIIVVIILVMLIQATRIPLLIITWKIIQKLL